MVREHTALTATAQATREAFVSALATRLVRPRYGSGLPTHSHLYDIAHLLCPETRSLRYLKTVKQSTLGQRGGFEASVDYVKHRIFTQARSLLADGIQQLRDLKAASPTVPVVEVSAPRTKRFKSGAATAASAQAQAERDKLKRKGLVDSSSDEEDAEGGGEPLTTPTEEADEILKKWMAHKVRKINLTVAFCVARSVSGFIVLTCVVFFGALQFC